MRPILRLLTASALCLLAATPAHALWPHDPDGDAVRLRPAQTLAYTQSVCPDGQGGFISVWDENTVIYGQHVDAAGRLLWGTSAIAIAAGSGSRYNPSACPDGSGGVIVAWQDLRSGNWDIYAQRLNSAGGAQWAANGVAVCTNSASQTNTVIVGDGAGNAVVAWQDSRSGASRAFARGLTSGGVPTWTADGTELSASALGNQSELRAAYTRSGLIVFVWDDSRADLSDVYYQAALANGTLVFPGGNVLAAAAGAQLSPQITIDSSVGALVAWSDARSGGNDIYAQRIGGNGSALWTAGGVPVCTNVAGQSNAAIAADAGGGAYVVWEDNRNAVGSLVDLFAQHLSTAGAPLWAVDGVAVCTQPGNQSAPRAVADATGGVILAWLDDRTLDTVDYDLYAQHLTTSGTALWTAQGVALSTSPTTSPTEVALCGDGRGGAIASARFQSTGVIRHAAVRIDEFGVLGGEPAIASVKDVPNDQGGQVKLSWNASPLDTDPLFRNISQYWLYRAAPPNAVAAARRAGAQVATPATAAAGATPPRWLQTRYAAQDYYWEIAATVTAAHLATYSELVATSSDSVGAGNPRTAFMVMARNSSGSQWWTSAPDSGYSVDNLPPAAPAPFTGQYAAGTARLHWDPNGEADIAGYELYRGGSASFTPGPANLVTTQPDTGYADAAGAPFVYKLLAVDSHGNRSPVATLVPAGTLGVEGGATPAFFAPPSPNPSRAGGMLRFGLATPGAVKLALYDAQGRLVRTLFGGALAAGEHAIAFDGRGGDGRALAPGLYLARLTAPGFAATRRVAVIE